jgi:aspartyl-tRNA(Asn)/glutamyl-tRNA(Gln) amidotransferase subunit B
VPLIEIVSNPDFRSAEEVVAYLEKLRQLLSFANVSDCKMQEGSMRCDVNISVMEKGATEYGVRTEIKNMNSLKAIAAAINYEAQRQIDALETASEELVQETRRWDDSKGQTFSMRQKEDATDYRYFPNTELMPISIEDKWIEEVRANLPEAAHDRFLRLTEKLGLSEYDSNIITGSKNLSDIFDKTMEYFSKPKEVANWIIVELLSIAKGDNKGEDDVKIDCKKFAKLMELVDSKVINRNVGKDLLSLVLTEDIDPEKYVEENKLGMISDTDMIDKVVQEVLVEFSKSVEEYKEGNQKVFGFLVGQTMRKLGGKANPQLINSLLKKHLS